MPGGSSVSPRPRLVKIEMLRPLAEKGLSPLFFQVSRDGVLTMNDSVARPVVETVRLPPDDCDEETS